MRLSAVVVVVLALGVCSCAIQADLVPCGDLVCPASTQCVADMHCATADQIGACTSLADRDPCAFAGRVGFCDLGVCIPTACGNAIEDAGEACDDGNVVGGDGCSADCRKIELCGDAFPDEGESCDDGNTNLADGCDTCRATAWVPTATIGGNAKAVETVVRAYSVTVDGYGNAYIGGWGRVMRVDTSGVITHVAGTGQLGPVYAGDGGPATSAGMGFVRDIAIDGLGNIFIADSDNHRVRRIDTEGIISTIAGTGIAGFSGDGGPATSARLSYPMGVAVDGLGNVYVGDTLNSRVRRIDLQGNITTVAGTGVSGFAGDGGPATTAQLARPTSLAFDATGALLIVVTQRVRRVDSTGTISTIAGGGTGFATGVPATSVSLRPSGVAADDSGSVFISDEHVVLRVDSSGVLHLLAGTGYGFAGDGGPATAALLRSPASVAVAASGHVFIADQGNNRLRRVDPAGIITTVAGNGLDFSTGDGGAATGVTLGAAAALALDGAGNLFVGDMYQLRVRRIDPLGVITTTAGTGERGTSGDGGPATSATFYGLQGIAVDAQGTLYIADTYNCRVRKVDASGTITAVAGNENTCYSDGDGGPAIDATLDYPSGLAIDAQGRLLIADTDGHRVRRVEATGTITTIAGTGVCDYSGDDGPATAATMCGPTGIAVDGANVYIADRYNNVVRKVDAAGTMTTVAGNASLPSGFSGDGGPATSASLYWPTGVAVDGAGAIYIADASNHRVRRVSPTGTITTVAGTGVSGADGDGGPAVSAQLAEPLDVVVDLQGRIYIADSDSERVRRIELDGTITTVAGPLDAEGMGPLAQARLSDPRALTIGQDITLFAGGSSGRLMAARSGWLEVVAGRYPSPAPSSNRARYQSATFGEVAGVAYDAPAHIAYITESTANRIHAITMVNPGDPTTWTIASYANAAGAAGFADGAVSSARFRNPTGLFLDEVARELYVADTGNHAIRAIDLATGVVRTVAGVPQERGFHGDGGAATSALMYQPKAITRCANGDLFVADTGNQRVRRIASTDATITTVLGDGTAASSGEGIPAWSFPVHSPAGLACDAYNNVFVTSTTAVRLLAADASGTVDGSGSVKTIYGATPRLQFPESATGCLTGIASVADRLQVVDSCAGIMVELERAVIP